MAEYYINNTPISQFGIIPIKANGNIAVSGCFNLPKRKGTTYYDWVLDDSVEPYVESDDIEFESREISLSGIISSDAETHLPELEEFIGSLPEKFSLSTSRWGNYTVKYKSIDIETITKDICKVVLKFLEPKITKTTPAKKTTPGDIDGYSWSDFGIILKGITGYQNIGAKKSLSVTQNTSCSLPSYGGKNKTEITVDGFVNKNNPTMFLLNSLKLLGLFGAPGLRTIQYRDREIKCFCANGYTVSDVFYVDKNVWAKFSCKLIVVSNERIQDIQG